MAEPLTEMVRALETLAVRGLPFFADSFDLARGLLRHLQRSPIPNDRHESLKALKHQLDQAFSIAIAGGHFVMLAGLPRPEGFPEGHGALEVKEILQTIRP